MTAELPDSVLGVPTSDEGKARVIRSDKRLFQNMPEFYTETKSDSDELHEAR